jgi:hypothetical protein
MMLKAQSQDRASGCYPSGKELMMSQWLTVDE